MTQALDWLFVPLQFEFIRQAILIAFAIAIPTALLSCFLVVKGWALMGDAISHAVFPGIVLAYIAGLPLEVGAVIAAMLFTVGSGYLKTHCKLKQDAVIGVVFSGMFGLGLVLYTAIQSEVHLDHILFGDILGVSWRNLAESGLITLVVVVVLGCKWRDFLLHIFDPQQARIAGLHTHWLHYGLLLLLALTVVGGIKAVGIILVISLLITPGAIAFMLTRDFVWMLIISTLVSLFACTVSIILSFHLDSAPAATIVVMLTFIFLILLVREGLSTTAPTNRLATDNGRPVTMHPIMIEQEAHIQTEIAWMRANLSEQAFRAWYRTQQAQHSAWLDDFERQVLGDSIGGPK